MRSNKYRSGLEQAFANKDTQSLFLYEPYTIPYVIERSYKPDFVNDEAKIIVECKGFFKAGDLQKYKSVRDCLPEGYELVFVLYDQNKRVRKGSKLTMGDWCTKEGLKFYTIETMHELLKYVAYLKRNKRKGSS